MKIEYSKIKVKNNLKKWIDSDINSDWYIEAHNFASELAVKHGLELYIVAGVISAFSPQKHWIENKRQASLFLSGKKVSGIYGANLDKAKRILGATNPENVASILNGSKTQRFFWNIYKPLEITGVTIDRHALACCYQVPGKTEAMQSTLITPKQYEFFEQCYMELAAKHNVLPHVLQSYLWERYRTDREISYTINSPF